MHLLKEPLLHFLLIGGALFLIYGARSNPTYVSGGQFGASEMRILVSRVALDQLNDQFVKTWHRQPSREEEQAIIEDYIRNEIYYREAVAIGLERDDEVLKRRLRQKMEFIYENINSLAVPTDAELTAFVNKHADRYITDPMMAFRQVYVSTYRRGSGAETYAKEILKQLQRGADPETLGDVTMLEPEIKSSPIWDIRKQFGDEFCQNLLQIKPGKWSDPVRSTYGLHLVLVQERSGGRMPNLEEVRELVKRDWTFEKQKELKDAAYTKLRQRYTITMERPEAGATPVATTETQKGVKVQ